jgi:hypothetical protein
MLRFARNDILGIADLLKELVGQDTRTHLKNVDQGSKVPIRRLRRLTQIIFLYLLVCVCLCGSVAKKPSLTPYA